MSTYTYLSRSIPRNTLTYPAFSFLFTYFTSKLYPSRYFPSPSFKPKLSSVISACFLPSQPPSFSAPLLFLLPSMYLSPSPRLPAALHLHSFVPSLEWDSFLCRLIVREEKWELETRRGTKQAFDSNGIMRWVSGGLNIEIMDRKSKMSNGHLNRSQATLNQS